MGLTPLLRCPSAFLWVALYNAPSEGLLSCLPPSPQHLSSGPHTRPIPLPFRSSLNYTFHLAFYCHLSSTTSTSYLFNKTLSSWRVITELPWHWWKDTRNGRYVWMNMRDSNERKIACRLDPDKVQSHSLEDRERGREREGERERGSSSIFRDGSLSTDQHSFWDFPITDSWAPPLEI